MSHSVKIDEIENLFVKKAGFILNDLCMLCGRFAGYTLAEYTFGARVDE